MQFLKTTIQVTVQDTSGNDCMRQPGGLWTVSTPLLTCLFTKSVHCHHGIDLHISVLEC